MFDEIVFRRCRNFENFGDFIFPFNSIKHISYCQFRVITNIMIYMLNETVFIQIQ